MIMKGIDVSIWQGIIDWTKVRNDGTQFAILKAGGSDAGFYKDSTFEGNYLGCKAAGIHVGAYYFVGRNCTSKSDGEADAHRFIEMLKGKQFDMPVYLDFEAPTANDINGNTQAAIGFCNVMEKAGYYVGIYASDISGFKEKLHASALRQFTWWVARYGDKPVYAVNSLGMWQYSSNGTVNGIKGRVDMDECYVDFPTAIKSKGLNGYGNAKPVTKPAVKIPVQPVQPASTGINVGDTVRPNILKDYNGNSLTSYHNTYTVSELKGDRAVLTVNGQVWAAMNVNNLSKVSETSVQNSPINVGDRVRVTNAVTYTGQSFKTWYDTYTVMELKGNRAVIGVNGTVTAAINVNNIAKV